MGATARLWRAVRRPGRRRVPGTLILAYHRLADLPSDPQLLVVTPQHFAEHLAVVRKHGRPMSLLGLQEALQVGAVPDRGLVITFDDGYADNLHSAKGLLQDHDVPATVFITIGSIGSTHEFWWDELDRLLLGPGVLPRGIRLTIDGHRHEWELGEETDYSEAAWQRHRSWNVLLPEDPTPRHRIYRSLCRLLRQLPEAARCQVLDELRSWARVGATGRPSHRALSQGEVIRLADGGLVDVGAHSVTHPVLSSLPVPAQRAEILEGKIHLEGILGHSVTSFAYPYGGSTDYTQETVRIVRGSGFGCACANFPDGVRQGADPFQLPRVLVRDWDGEEFARRLDGWFRG